MRGQKNLQVTGFYATGFYATPCLRSIIFATAKVFGCAQGKSAVNDVKDAAGKKADDVAGAKDDINAGAKRVVGQTDSISKTLDQKTK